MIFSKIAWLADNLDDKIAKMTVRVGDMTGRINRTVFELLLLNALHFQGLSMETVEQFQAQTYGIGIRS